MSDNQTKYRIKCVEEILSAIKDEPYTEGCGDSDFGGMLRSELPGTSSGTSHQEFVQVVLGDGQSSKEQNVSSIPWDTTPLGNDDFINPRGESSSDQSSEESSDEENTECIPRGIKYEKGYATGVQDVIEQLNEIPEIKNIGKFKWVNGHLTLLKKQDSDLDTGENQNRQENEEDQATQENRENQANTSSESAKKDLKLTESLTLNGDDFLDIIEMGLEYPIEGGSIYLSLSSVSPALFEVLKGKIMSLDDWIKQTCF
ncbi:phosphoprotein [Ouango virus]|uniref:Phosphoprotein n=1 Tax=Ouango virus TaxID=864692 RepID=A0AAE8XEP0_9RHAB|nr:phosphoprotein [Ouango virus]UAU42888.1 phosphoprotein [Ouango virus]